MKTWLIFSTLLKAFGIWILSIGIGIIVCLVIYFLIIKPLTEEKNDFYYDEYFQLFPRQKK